MGVLNFIWDLSQSGQISELNDKVEELEEKVEILYEWVQYFKKELDKKNEETPS